MKFSDFLHVRCHSNRKLFRVPTDTRVQERENFYKDICYYEKSGLNFIPLNFVFLNIYLFCLIYQGSILSSHFFYLTDIKTQKIKIKMLFNSSRFFLLINNITIVPQIFKNK